VKLGSSHRWSKALVVLGVFATCAFVPAYAAANSVPSGSTEGDQYFEEAPNGGGSGSINRHGDGGGGSGGVPPVAATQALNAQGPDGQAAADIANSNRPPEVKANQGQNAGNGTSGTQPASSSTEGDGGMGLLFPILIAVTALAAIGYGLRRRLNPA